MIRAGIVGLHPGRGWGLAAHVPALRALSHLYDLAGVANASLASAEAAARACGVPRAFASATELAQSPDIDLVVVTVKVPAHAAIVDAALEAGKHVYCEWPIGLGLAEAEAMAAKARSKGVVAVAGTQARVAPTIRYARDLVANGHVGEILSTTIVANGRSWGAEIDKASAWTLDRENGGNLLTIALGHAMAAAAGVVGPVAELSATLATRRSQVRVVDTGETAVMSSPDQVLVAGLLESGAPISIHYRGGMPRGTGFMWEINGTEGDLRITGSHGLVQLERLVIEGASGTDEKLAPLTVPDRYRSSLDLPLYAENVAAMYAMLASDVRDGTRHAPSFADAVATHRLCDAIERSAAEGRRVTV